VCGRKAALVYTLHGLRNAVLKSKRPEGLLRLDLSVLLEGVLKPSSLSCIIKNTCGKTQTHPSSALRLEDKAPEPQRSGRQAVVCLLAPPP